MPYLYLHATPSPFRQPIPPPPRRFGGWRGGLIALLLALSFGTCVRAQGIQLNGQTTTNPEIEVEACTTLNDARTQFAPTLYEGRLVYVHRPRRGAIDPRTRLTYLQRYAARLSVNGWPQKPKPFAPELSGNFNEGPAAFNSAGNVIYFTRNLQRAGGAINDRVGAANLGIYSAYRAEYGWADIRALPVNGTEFSTQQPSLSEDGRKLFFASNRPGGYGGYDLYFSIRTDGRWGPAINLGPEINTSGNEVFPFLHPGGRLFFVSNGHPGQGGLDLYAIDVSGRVWGKVLNLPAPLNSPADETGITLDDDGKIGFLASNRAGGQGEDDLYRFALRRGFASLGETTPDGALVTVYNGATSGRVRGANVRIIPVNPAGRPAPDYLTFRTAPGGSGNATASRTGLVTSYRPVPYLPATGSVTGYDGTTRVELTPGNAYALLVDHPGYATQQLLFRHTSQGPSHPLEVVLQPTNCTRVALRVNGANGRALSTRVRWIPTGACSGQPPVEVMTDVLGYAEVCLPARGCEWLVNWPDVSVAGRIPLGTAQLRSGPGVPPRAVTPAANNNLGLIIRPEDLPGYVAPRLDVALNVGPGAVTVPGSPGPVRWEMNALQFAGSTPVIQLNQSPDLDLAVTLLRERADLQLTVAVHTDGAAATAELLTLGEQRAMAVRNELLERGIAPDRVRTIAYGNRFRRVPCTACTEADYGRNNYVEGVLEAMR